MLYFIKYTLNIYISTMAHVHAFQIEKLRNDFDNIITLKREISKVKTVVSEKLSQLKLVYNDLIKNNSKKYFVLLGFILFSI